MDDESEPDQDRRALIGLACGLPFVGGVIELIARASRHAPERRVSEIPGRAALDPSHDRELPVESVYRAAEERKEDERAGAR